MGTWNSGAGCVPEKVDRSVDLYAERPTAYLQKEQIETDAP